MTVFRETTLHYGDKSYALVPSNKLMRRIDGQMIREGGRGVLAVFEAAGRNEQPVFELAFIMAEFLRAAGCNDVDEDSMYADMMDDFMNNGGAVVAALVQSIAEAITPTPRKAEGQEPKKAPPKRKAAK